MFRLSPLLVLSFLGMTALGWPQEGGSGRGAAARQAAGGKAPAEAGRPAGAGRAAREAGGVEDGAQSVAGSALLPALDRDGDKSLSAGEIDLAVVSLRALDRDGDGSVSSAEMSRGPRPNQAKAEPANAKPAAPAMRDTDGDGKITAADLPPSAQARFDDYDANGDGELDAEEQGQLMADFQARKGSGGAGAGAGGGKTGAAQGDAGRTQGGAAKKGAGGGKSQAGGAKAQGKSGAKKKLGGF